MTSQQYSGGQDFEIAVLQASVEFLDAKLHNDVN